MNFIKQSLIFLIFLVLGLTNSVAAQTVDVTSQIATSSAAQIDVDVANQTNKSIVNSSASQAVDEISKKNKCSAECRQMLEQEIFRGTMCAPAVNVHPIPGVFQACKDGELSSFRQACKARCTASVETVPFEKLSSFHACAKHEKGPREKFNWCRRGYDANKERLSVIASSNIDEDGSVEESAEDESVLNYNDVSLALVQEGEQAVERQPVTLQVASQSKEVGSAVTEEESVLRPFDSQRTQLEVLSSQEAKAKYLQHGHGAASFEADSHFMTSRSEVSSSSLFDMLPSKVSDLDTPTPTSSAAPNADIRSRFVLHSWTDQFFLATPITVKIDEPFSTASIETDIFTYTGSSCNVHGTRSRGSYLYTLFLLMEEVFKDNNTAVWSDESSQSPRYNFIKWYTAQVLVAMKQETVLQAVESSNESNFELSTTTNVTSRKLASVDRYQQTSLNCEGFGIDATVRSWSLADYLTLESTVRPDLRKIDPRQLSFRKLLHQFWPEVPFKEEDDLQYRSELVGSLISAGMSHQSIHFLETSRDYQLQVEDVYSYTHVNDQDLFPDKCNLPSQLDAIFVTAGYCGVKSQSNQRLLTKSLQLRLCRWKYPDWPKLKLKELDAQYSTAAKPSPSTLVSGAFLVGNKTAKANGYEWLTFPIGYSFQSQADHLECQCTKTPDGVVDTGTVQVVTPLQLSLGVASHVWPIHTRTRLKSAGSLQLAYLNRSSEYIIPYRTRSVISHLDRDVDQSGRSFGTMATIATATLFMVMVLYFYHSTGGRIRQLEPLTTNQKAAQLTSKVTLLQAEDEKDGREDGSSDRNRNEALVIEWTLQWRQEPLNIGPLLSSMGFCWKDKRRKLQLATKALACSSAAVRWKCGT